MAHRRGLGRGHCQRHSAGEGRDAERVETLRNAGCVVDEVDCGFSKDQKFVFMRGLMLVVHWHCDRDIDAHQDLLSPYMVEILGQVGTVGPRQAEEADAFVEKLHRQVQRRRLSGKGYRVVLMPTMATPLVGADMFKSKKTASDPSGRAPAWGPRLT